MKRLKFPFLVLGRWGAPASNAEDVQKIYLAKYGMLPIEQQPFNNLLLRLLDPLVDPEKEKAYEVFDEAEKLNQAEDPSAAAWKYEQALDLYPQYLEACFKLAEVHAKLGQWEEAEKTYLKALEIDEYHIPAYQALAALYSQRGQFEPAIGILRQAIGIALITKASQKVHSRLAFQIGELDLKLKKTEEAGVAFDRAIQSAPDDGVLREDIGDAYAAEGNHALAEGHYRAALDVDPSLVHVFNKLGISYRKLNQPEKALELFENARMYRPDDENLLFNTARAHYEIGSLEEARNILTEALKIAPRFKAALVLLEKMEASGRVVDLEAED